MNGEWVDNIGFGGLRLIQKKEGFRFGVDAVILADYAWRFCPEAATAVDLGTGNGAVSFILSHKIPGCRITGVDIQQEAVDIAERSCIINGLQDRMEFICCDVNNLLSEHSCLKGTADIVLSNPPYIEKGCGITRESSRMIARQETTAGIEDFISAAEGLLKERGHFFLVHRPSRLVDIFYYCRKHRLEPKDLRLVAPVEGASANIALIHCVLGGGHQLNVSDTLFVRNSDGCYSREILEIYEKNVEKISK